MKSYRLLSVLAGLCLLVFHVNAVTAQQMTKTDVPRTISYQGILSAPDGTPLPDGTHTITVTLYGNETGTERLWQDRYETTTVNGLFNLYLGSNHPLPSPLEMNRPLWVGTSVDGGTEMLPLTALSSSPYALNLPDGAVTTAKLADRAVTAEKMGVDYVSGIMVNGEKVNGNEGVLNLVGTPSVPLRYDEATGSITIGTELRASQSGDQEKQRSVQHNGGTNTGTEFLWSMSGDGWEDNVGGVQADNNDWIGTSQNFNMTIKANNARVMQYRPNATSVNILGGHSVNSIGTGVGNVIAGGGTSGFPNSIGDNDYSVVGGGTNNVITGDDVTISGGTSNTASNDFITISGGGYHTASGLQSTIGGGNENQATATSATVGGGETNVASGNASTIAGGISNQASGIGSTIGGGSQNQVSADDATIGGGVANTVSANSSTIAGGWDNSITGVQSVIAGGIQNVIESISSGIAGGDNNKILADNAFIGGGKLNKINDAESIYAVIGGGEENLIESAAEYAVIGSGKSNTILADNSFIATGRTNKIEGHSSAILSGHTNVIRVVPTSDFPSQQSIIGSGIFNTIYAAYGFIGTGGFNVIGDKGTYSLIVGGQQNLIAEDHSFTGGGYNHLIENSYSSIVGGFSNEISGGTGVVPSGASFIGGGQENLVHGMHSSIVGGRRHIIGNDDPSEGFLSSFSFIGGGDSNRIFADYAVVTGGKSNRINPLSNWGFIGGGDSNIITDHIGVIAGGRKNTISNYNGTISGGRGNVVSGHTATIAGGFENQAEATESSIGGGIQNVVAVNAEKSTIGGGGWNTIQPTVFAGTIGGGSSNTIRVLTGYTPNNATIPGGDNLIAQSWAQTVIGGWNVPKGNVTSRYSAGGDPNGPIFIIGNGYDEPHRSNAFEVSYNGHSIVFDENGTGGKATTTTGRGVVEGGTYTDNVIYGWAEVSATGDLVSSCADFGILDIQKSSTPTTTRYRITLNPVGPDGYTPYGIDCGAVVATLGTGVDPDLFEDANFPCMAFIVTSNIKGNMFDVYISQIDPLSGYCKPADLPFKFHVTGRPHP